MFNYSGYNDYMQPQIPRYNNQMNFNAQMQPNMQQNVPNYNPQPVPPVVQGLQGKTVDSIDVVKAMDIPLDGSISYFPLTDGSAIVTKQLQQDGTSKTMIYKAVDNIDTSKPNYVTTDELQEQLKNVNSKELKDIKDDIKNIKREIRDISYDIKDKKED